MVVEKFPDGRRPFAVGGLKIVPCPAETRGATCADCRICLDRPLERLKIGVAFEVHGPTAKRAAAKLVQIRGRSETRVETFEAKEAAGESIPSIAISKAETAEAIAGRLRAHGRHTFLELVQWAQGELGGEDTDELRRRFRKALDEAVAAGAVIRAADGVGRPVYSAAAWMKMDAPVRVAKDKHDPVCAACGKTGHGWCDAGAPPPEAPKLRALPPAPPEERKPMSKEEVSVSEAAKIIKASIPNFYRLVRQGKIFGTGKPMMFKRAECLVLAAARAADPTPARKPVPSPGPSARTKTRKAVAKAAAGAVVDVDEFIENVRLLAAPWAAGILPGAAMVDAIAKVVEGR